MILKLYPKGVKGINKQGMKRNISSRPWVKISILFQYFEKKGNKVFFEELNIGTIKIFFKEGRSFIFSDLKILKFKIFFKKGRSFTFSDFKDFKNLKFFFQFEVFLFL